MSDDDWTFGSDESLAPESEAPASPGDGSEASTLPGTDVSPAAPLAESPDAEAGLPPPESNIIDLGPLQDEVSDREKAEEAPALSPAETAFEAKVASIEAKIEALLEGQRSFQQQQQAAQSQAIDPLTQPQDWVRIRRQMYLRAGHESVSEDLLHRELVQAQNSVLQENQRAQEEKFQTLQSELGIARHEKAIAAELDVLVAKYPNVQGTQGTALLEMALAQAAARGETDLESVVRRAHEMVPRLALERYGPNKQRQAAAVGGSLPRGGAPRAPGMKQYKGIDAIRNFVSDLIPEE